MIVNYFIYMSMETFAAHNQPQSPEASRAMEIIEEINAAQARAIETLKHDCGKFLGPENLELLSTPGGFDKVKKNLMERAS